MKGRQIRWVTKTGAGDICPVVYVLQWTESKHLPRTLGMAATLQRTSDRIWSLGKAPIVVIKK